MKFLHKPHPFIYTKASILIPGLITFLLIVIIAPFDFRKLDLEWRLVFALAIGITCSLSVVLVVELLKKVFASFINEEKWTVGKEIFLFLLVTTTICINIFLLLLGFNLTDSAPVELFLTIVGYTLSIGFFPIVILVLYEQYNHQKKQLIKARELSELVKEPIDGVGIPEDENQKILFEAENGKVELQLATKDILYLESDGNYVDVYYFDSENTVQKKLIRNRLKSLASQLPPDTFFLCHRSYVVNGHHIIRVEGNARNFELVLKAVNNHIPVARSKSDLINNFLKSLK